MQGERAAPESPPAIGREGRPTVALVVFCQIVQGTVFSALPLLLPLIREDLQLTFTQAGLLSAAATFTYALGQIPSGYLADRHGPRWLFFTGLLMWSALSLAFGAVHAFWLAVLVQLVAGAFRALLFAPGLTLLASWFAPERRATAMSLYMLGGFAGTIVFSLAGPALAARYGWRATFMLFAALGIAAALVYAALSAENPRARAAHPPALGDLGRLLRRPILWVCAGLQFLRFTVVTAFHLWLPSLLVEDRGFSVQAAGLVVAASAALTAVSNTLGGYLSDRLRNPPLVIGGALAMLAATSLLIAFTEQAPLLLVVIAVNAVFLQFYFGPLFMVPVEVLGPRVAGTVTGFANLFANLGGILSAWLLGAARDATGAFAWGFAGVGLACIAGVLLAAALARMRRRALAAQAA
ncbi:MAG TPA: MFS transporter [Burkholderiales bacterium]|nr:MFS transporter [Burkholderiales bacterium]